MKKDIKKKHEIISPRTGLSSVGRAFDCRVSSFQEQTIPHWNQNVGGSIPPARNFFFMGGHKEKNDYGIRWVGLRTGIDLSPSFAHFGIGHFATGALFKFFGSI